MALCVALRGGGGGLSVLQKAGVHLVCGPLCSSQGEGGGGSSYSTEGWSTPGLWFSVCVWGGGGEVFLFYRRLEYTWSVVLGGGSSCSTEGWSTPCLWFSVGGGVVSVCVCVCGGGGGLPVLQKAGAHLVCSPRWEWGVVVFLFYRGLEYT